MSLGDGVAGNTPAFGAVIGGSNPPLPANVLQKCLAGIEDSKGAPQNATNRSIRFAGRGADP